MVLAEVTAPIGSRTRFVRLPGGGYVYDLIDEAVTIELRYLRREHGHLYAEVDVQCSWADVRRHNGSISCADHNLSSQTARKSLAKYCAERAKTKPDDFDWMGAIDASCLETIKAERYGDDPIVLDDADDTIEQDHDVLGLAVPADSTSLIAAHGGSLKSLITLFVVGNLALAGMRVLYLDWEWTAERHKARKRKLFGTERIPNLYYLRCKSPITVEVDRIRRFADKHNIVFFGVDSVGLAADGKLADDDTAIRFHRALGSLPGGKLCAAHVPKSSLAPDANQSDPRAFGSVFFENLCRAVWIVRKQTEGADKHVTVGLYPTKQTEGERKQPAGLSFDFSSERIEVLRTEGRAASTRNKYVQLVKAMFRWAVKKGYLSRNPVADSDTIKREKHAKRNRRLVPDVLNDKGAIEREGEERRLLAVAGPHLQRLIIGAIETGMRRGELLALVWRDVNVERKEITVRAETTKTQTTRVLPVSSRLAAVLEMARTALETFMDSGPTKKVSADERAAILGRCYVFGDAAGLKVGNVKRAWETAVLKAHGHTPQWTKNKALAGPSRAALAAIDLHFHDCRHESGSRLLESGWPLHHVQEMLGHANVSQTSTYLNATRVGLQESMRRFDNGRSEPPTGTQSTPSVAIVPSNGQLLVN
jgi:integrase